jgi:hypothetical protein
VTAEVDGSVSVSLTPDRTTAYRWYMPPTGYADGGFSAPVTVRVTPPAR